MAKKNSKRKMTKKARRKRKIILLIVEVFVLLLLLGAAVVASKYNKLNRSDIDENELSINNIDKDSLEYMDGYFNVALFGLDNRSTGTYESGNSDSIIIASINQETKEVKLVSVYRDTYLYMGTNHDYYTKVNAAYNLGGPTQALSVLNMNFDMNIKDYVAVDWYAVAETIDLLGGIDIEVSEAEAAAVNKYIDEGAKSTGLETEGKLSGEGMMHLDGVQALTYARIRKGVGDDYARTERQREVISAMLEEAQHASITTLNSIVDEVLGNISTSLSATELLTLASYATQYSIGDSTGFPFEQTTEDVGSSGSCVIAGDLASNVEELHEFLYPDDVGYTISNTVESISEEIVSETGISRIEPKESSDSEDSDSSSSGSSN